MNKKQRDQLYTEEGLSVGFKNVLNEIHHNYAFDYERLDSAEKIAHDEIEKEYSKKKNDVKKREKRVVNELNDYLKMVEKYSTFVIDELGCIIDVITEITSIFMGEEYEFDDIKINNKAWGTSLLIYPKRLNDYQADWEPFIDEGIVLNLYDDVDEDKINFYEASISSNDTLNLEKMKLRASKNSLKHKFLLDFIDFVVKYRIEKQADEISFVELKRLELLFIFKRREELEEINRQKALKEREDLEQKIMDRESLLKNYVGVYEDDQVVQNIVNSKELASGKMLKKLIESFDRDTLK